MKFMIHTLKIVRITFKKIACGAIFTKFRERIEKKIILLSIYDYTIVMKVLISCTENPKKII
jgi:hypothetical protein